VDPNNTNCADGNGGIDEYAQWNTELSDPHTIRLKSARTGKYLRIHNQGKTIDVEGVGGEFCNFRYHREGQFSHAVKLESESFEGCYVAVSNQHYLEIGKGGPHCVLHFYRQTNDIDDFRGNEVPVQMQSEMKQMEEASPVGQWLKSLNLNQYADVFIKNGFDQLKNVGNITESDLKQMNVALGHIKTILIAAQHVTYIGHTISIRGTRWKVFLKATPHKNHDHATVTSVDKLEGLSQWKVKELPNNKISLENIQEQGFYLSLPNKDDEEVSIKNHIKDWEMLEIDHHPHDATKLVLKCPSNATYLAIKEPKLIGHNPVHVVFDPKDESQLEFSILD